MILRMTIEVELDEGFIPIDEDMRTWLEEDVLGTKMCNLRIHSNDVGETIGTITSIGDIDYLEHKIVETKHQE